MYWRRFRISEIPVDNDAAFAMWLKNRWTEKDYLLEHFFRHGAFPEGDPVKAMKTEAALLKVAKANSNGLSKKVIKPLTKTAKFITTEIKAGGWEEFLSIFGPITAAATALSSGELSPENIDFDALLNKVAQQQQMNLLTTGKAPKAPKTHEEMRRALTTASKAAAAGLPVQKGTIETITQNAAQQQREILEAMTKNSPPKNGLPKGKSPTEGRKLDPTIQKAIDSVHQETRERLIKASRPASQVGKQAPNVRKSIPMTPMETVITRPLSTLAMQKATQRVQRAATSGKMPQFNKAVAAKSQSGSPAAKQSPSKPASASGRRDSVQSGGALKGKGVQMKGQTPKPPRT